MTIRKRRSSTQARSAVLKQVAIRIANASSRVLTTCSTIWATDVRPLEWSPLLDVWLTECVIAVKLGPLVVFQYVEPEGRGWWLHRTDDQRPRSGTTFR